MLNTILDFVILFLLFYAIFSISVKLTDFVTKKSDCEIMHATVCPKESDNLEYTIRCAAAKCCRIGITLVIIDTGLSDDAKYIIDALKNEFSGILLLTPLEYTEKFL